MIDEKAAYSFGTALRNAAVVALRKLRAKCRNSLPAIERIHGSIRSFGLRCVALGSMCFRCDISSGK